MPITPGMLEKRLEGATSRLYGVDLGEPQFWFEKFGYLLENYPKMFFEGCMNLDNVNGEGLSREELMDIVEKETKKKEYYLAVPQDKKREVRNQFYEAMLVNFANIDERFRRTRRIALPNGRNVEIDYTFLAMDGGDDEDIAQYFLDEEAKDNIEMYRLLVEGLGSGKIKRRSAKDLFEFKRASELEIIERAISSGTYSELARIELTNLPVQGKELPIVFKYLPKKIRQEFVRVAAARSNTMRIYVQHEGGKSRISLLSGLDDMNNESAQEDNDWQAEQYQRLLKAVPMPMLEHLGPLSLLYPREGIEYTDPQKEIKTIVDTLEIMLKRL